MGIVSEPTKFERIHQLLRKTLSSSSVAMCVWSSFANLSISRITSSVRPTSIMVFRNLSSRMNDRECSRIVVSYTSFGVDSQCDILDHLFLSVSVTVWSTFPDVKVRNREEVKI